MTQADLFSAPAPVPPRSGRVSLAAKLAEYFQARPNIWIDAHELLGVAGFAAWRTRVSELRRAPWLMVIENRERTVETRLEIGPYRGPVRRVKVSEYRYVPTSVSQDAEERCT